ncbi:MAG: tol-pal system protein YbgF [Candidatus Latescibacteria bacterium]|jgi:tol-pal system protein YbgF|nr:tol-pal system protein YbgF [Candidatus Latescibacterota bacterium]
MKRRDLALRILSVFINVYIFSFLTVSCATKKDLVELRTELYDRNDKVESRLLSIEHTTASIDSLLREQNRLTQSLRALMGAQSQEQLDNISLIAARQDEINQLLRGLLDKLQLIQLYGTVETKPSVEKTSQTPETSNLPVSSAVTSKVNPEKLYDSALEDIRNYRFQLAESRFLSFLMQFPKHELAGNAQYWLGEAVYGQKKYNLAITEFEKVLKNYKKSIKVPAAMLKIGYAQFELEKTKTAINTLNRLIKSYPKSQEARLARERLNAP